MSTCRLVDLSTCRPSAIVNNIDPVRVRVRLGLGLVSGLVSGLVWLSVRIGLGLGLGLTVDIHIGTIMTNNEDPSPNIIGRSTSRQFSFGSTDK